MNGLPSGEAYAFARYYPNGHYPASHQVAESLDRKRELKNRENHNRCKTDDRIDRAGREGDKAVQVS